MTIRLLLAASLWTALAIPCAIARDLTAVTSDSLLAAQRDVYFTPFTEITATPLRASAWVASLAALRTNAELWDLALMDGEDLLGACSDGLLEKLDFAAIGGRDRYQPQAITDCGVGAAIRSTVLAWDRDKFPGTANWSDFWDVAKYPGKRGLQHGARMNLEIALMADGVSPGDIYRTLRTDEGVDRAFRKLDQIKPYLVWWKSPAQAPGLIGSGDVLLSTAPGERIAALNQGSGRHLGTQPAASLYDIASWAILKASPNGPGALKLLAFMGDPARQARFAATSHFGVLAKDATDGLPPDQLAAAPSNPANLAAALQMDAQFWHDNATRLDARFDAWLAH